MYLQNRHSDRAQEAERARRAEVVAYRLSGWMGEAGVRITRALASCQEAQAKAKEGPPRLASELIPGLKLGIITNIEGVLPDLHYLAAGSGDVAQLDHFMHTYEAWLNRIYAEATEPRAEVQMMAGPARREFYGRAERQLSALSMFNADAERHIRPLVEKAIDGGR